MDLSLLVLRGKPQGKEVPIRVSPFLIGRGPECHMRPNSDMVSRLHCALTIHGQEVRIRDLGSTNGTIVDGERLTEQMTLNDGDIFQVGPLAFQVVIRAVAAEAHPGVAPTGTPVGDPQRVGVASERAKADDVVRWLVSDSKNEIPASGSGVYAGETVFTKGALENQPTSDTEPAQTPHGHVQPAAQAAATKDRAERKADEKKQQAGAPGGAAAHAAEDAIRRFLERRQHK